MSNNSLCHLTIQGYVEALAVAHDGRIIATGSSVDMLAKRAMDSVTVDLQGAHVIPVRLGAEVHTAIKPCPVTLAPACSLRHVASAALDVTLSSAPADLQGLIDPHVHLLKGGASLAGMDLFTVRTELEFKAEMKKTCGEFPPLSLYTEAAGP